MSKKSPKRFSHLPGPPPHPTGAVPTSDRFETASTDSFPASDCAGLDRCYRRWRTTHDWRPVA